MQKDVRSGINVGSMKPRANQIKSKRTDETKDSIVGRSKEFYAKTTPLVIRRYSVDQQAIA
jgi:hypothetical protein